MAKFKVGDKVRIIKNKNPEYIGDIVTIKSINPNAPYLTEPHYGVGRVFVMCEDELELVESKPFTKSDLKDGMVIEYRNGEKALVITDRFLSTNGWMSFDDYDSELLRTSFLSDAHHWDIVKCYKVTSDTGLCMLADLLKDRYLGLIWERKEEPAHKEMTVEEIEKELGYKIKVVADKE